MLQDIEGGKVNTVITKDMSRLGRDYIQTGHYMERYFPEHNVRYISILDGIDTAIDGGTSDITPFKALLNDFYAKDISKKIKSVKHYKQQQGLFIGGKAPYGYQMSADEKNRIVIDPVAGAVVCRIFELAAKGESCRRIAAILNEERVPAPAAYAGLRIKSSGAFAGLWSSERISFMLQNEVYVGNMVQGRVKKANYKSKKIVKQPKAHWTVVAQTHEGLVDKDTFRQVQQLISLRRSTRSRTYDYPLKGLVYCKECGYPLGIIKRKLADGEDVFYFICRTYQRFTKLRRCTSHTVRMDAVEEKVAGSLLPLLRASVMKQENIVFIHSLLEESDGRTEKKGQLGVLKAGLNEISLKMDRIYMDYISELLAEEDFQRIYQGKKKEREVLRAKIELLERQNKNPQSPEIIYEEFLRKVMENSYLLALMIRRIEINEEKELFIYMNFLEDAKKPD